MKFYSTLGISILLCFLFTGKSRAIGSKEVKDHIFSLHSQPYLNDSIRNALNSIVEEDSATLNNAEIYANFNNFLFQLESKNYKPYCRDQYYDILEGYRALLFTHNEDEIVAIVAQWLPDDYTIVKTLIPHSISEDLLKDITCYVPKEIIRQYAALVYIGDSSSNEIIAALKQFPSHVKQFLHYNNNIRTLCLTSKDTVIGQILKIYNSYKFSSNAYYLLPLIMDNTLQYTEAHSMGQDLKTLLKICTDYKINTSTNCYTSTDEKYTELSERYIRKIRIYRNSDIRHWDLEELSTSDAGTLFYFLVFNQNNMDNKELTKYISWLRQSRTLPLSEDILQSHHITLYKSLLDRVQPLFYRDSVLSLFSTNAWDKITPTKNMTTLNYGTLTAPKIVAEIPKPKLPKFIITKHDFVLPDIEKDKIFLYNNPEWVLDHLNSTGKKTFGKEILMHTACLYPLEFSYKADSFVLLPYGMDILKEICKEAPLTAKNFIINPQHKINALLKYLKDSTIAELFAIHQDAGALSKAYLLLEDIVHKNMDIMEADAITQDPNLYIPRLINNLVKSKSLGKYSIEQDLTAKALKFIRTYNISENTDLAEEKTLSKLTAEQLYIYMILGEEEIIYNTFKKMFVAWQNSVPDKVIFLEKMNYYKWETFYRKCAFYGLEQELLQNINGEHLVKVFSKIYPATFSYHLDSMIQTAEIIYYSRNEALLNYFEKKTKEGYESAEKTHDTKSLAAYTILAGFLGRKMSEEYWSYYVGKQYALPEYATISNFAIFNQNMTNVQQYYFYNDEDGISSYNNFIKTYQKSKSDWNIEDKITYVKISSLYGKKIELYANKPVSGDKGIEDIENYFHHEQVSPSIVVHRGLSTHTLKTFNRIPPETLLILDGSCGGYHVQQVALSRAPTAQILCNRNVGTMYINDPIFKQLNEEIRMGNTIVWQDFWSKIKQKVGNNPYFYDYIPPDKNIYAQLTTAYYHLLNIR